MGTKSATKFLRQIAGDIRELFALTTSVGAADADAIPALNANGVLDKSLLGGITTSTGASDSNKPIFTDGTGRIDQTVLPVGIGADTAVMAASEALAAGDFVNIFDGGSGAFKVRKADATTTGKDANGFVLAAVASGANATVYFEGTNTQVTGQTPGKVFLGTTAGKGTSAAPSSSGNVVQSVGFAVSATAVNFNAGIPITLG